MPEMKTLTVNGVKYTMPFAPDGYGLGANTAKPLTDANDLNSVRHGGWYRWSTSVPANAPMLGNDKTYGYMSVLVGDSTTCLQIVFTGRSAAKETYLVRAIVGGVVGEWEYINPPMQVGVEYRTTERNNGKAVYATRVALGTVAPGRTDITTNIVASSIVRTSNNPALFEKSEDNEKFIINIHVLIDSNGKILLRAVSGTSNLNYTMYCTVWYTKE